MSPGASFHFFIHRFNLGVCGPRCSFVSRIIWTLSDLVVVFQKTECVEKITVWLFSSVNKCTIKETEKESESLSKPVLSFVFTTASSPATEVFWIRSGYIRTRSNSVCASRLSPPGGTERYLLSRSWQSAVVSAVCSSAAF